MNISILDKKQEEEGKNDEGERERERILTQMRIVLEICLNTLELLKLRICPYVFLAFYSKFHFFFEGF